MKQFFSLAIAVFIVSAAQAQLNKGQWLVGGSASFAHSTNSNNNGFGSYHATSTSLQATPAVGYFVISKLAVGVRPGISTSNDKEDGSSQLIPYSISYSSRSKTTRFSISPFVRYYFLPAKSKVNLVGDVSYSYQHNTLHSATVQTSTDLNGMPIITGTYGDGKYDNNAFNFQAGPALMLSSKVSLELLAGYTIGNMKNTSYNERAVTIAAGFQIHLGK